MHIRIIQVGENKDGCIDEGLKEFIKRLQRFCKLEVVTLKEQSATSTVTVENCIEREGQQILKHLEGQNEFVVMMEVMGKQLTSEQFAEFLQSKKDLGMSICFIIGGPYGLSTEVLAKADYRLSFSKMTFTHQMIRVFLLEQIYRGFCIATGKRYHH